MAESKAVRGVCAARAPCTDAGDPEGTKPGSPGVAALHAPGTTAPDSQDMEMPPCPLVGERRRKVSCGECHPVRQEGIPAICSDMDGPGGRYSK